MAFQLGSTQVKQEAPFPAGLAIASGNITGAIAINKFGRNIEIDSGVLADVWDGGYTLASGGTSLLWVAPTASRIHNIASSSTTDASGAAGAKTIKIYGLVSWGTKEVSETIVMNGTTDVPTTKPYVIIHRMKVVTKGASGPNVGVITATAVTNSTVTASIRAGQGQTQMAIYGVPSSQTAYVMSFYTSMNKAGGASAVADINLLVNPEPDVETTKFLTKHTDGLDSTGTSHFNHLYLLPKKIAGPAIIKMQALSGTNNVDISSGFDMVLLDN